MTRAESDIDALIARSGPLAFFVEQILAGDVTACPVSPLATHNVNSSTLSEAFAGPLFAMIRENGELLETQDHPCALFANATKLDSLAAPLGAYRTGREPLAHLRGS